VERERYQELVARLRAICGDEHLLVHEHDLYTYVSDGLLQYQVVPQVATLSGNAEKGAAAMRLVSYESDGHWRAGILVAEGVLDAAATARDARAGADMGAWASNRTLIQTSEEERTAVAEAIPELESSAMPLAELRLGPPIPDPDKILCMGLNYRDHAAESGLPPPTVPLFFAKFRNSLIGPHDSIVLPAPSDQVDYEAELAVVIRRRCWDVAVEQALSYVAGAMAFNDVSARELQFQASQWTMGKAIDTFAPCGPALVLLDELSDLQALGIRARVNGQTLQDANTSLMMFGVAEAVAFLSRVMTLEPGDIIATGTPAGVGMARGPAGLATRWGRGRDRDRRDRNAAQPGAGLGTPVIARRCLNRERASGPAAPVHRPRAPR